MGRTGYSCCNVPVYDSMQCFCIHKWDNKSSWVISRNHRSRGRGQGRVRRSSWVCSRGRFSSNCWLSYQAYYHDHPLRSRRNYGCMGQKVSSSVREVFRTGYYSYQPGWCFWFYWFPVCKGTAFWWLYCISLCRDHGNLSHYECLRSGLFWFYCYFSISRRS